MKKPKELRKLVIKIYKKRQAAHDILLECDIAIDKILKKLIKK